MALARHPPIAILSFNRPAYLSRVVASLEAQRPPIDPSRVHLFQDGAPAADEGGHPDDPAAIKACVRRFRRAFPGGTVHSCRTNLGIAFNYDRAERFLFETLDAELGYFFEDDMVLSAHYLTVLGRLARFALRNDRIGYVAAYGDHTFEPTGTRPWPSHLMSMHHHWGFALTRRHWRRQRPVVDGYLRLLRQTSYARRPAEIIRAYFAKLGFPFHSTSQDTAKVVASMRLGVVRLMCMPAFGQYIGETGMHFSPALYEQMGFGRTQLADRALGSFVCPDNATIERLLEADIAHTASSSAVAFALESAKLEPGKVAPHQLVTLLYRGLLMRDPDPQGLAHYVTQLQHGVLSEVDLIQIFAASPEFTNVQQLLGRTPPPEHQRAHRGMPGRSTSRNAPMPDDTRAEPAPTH